MISQAPDKGKVISEIMKDEDMRKRGKDTTDAAKQITNLIHRLPPQVVERIVAVSLDENEVFENAREFIEKEFGLPLTIVNADDSTHQKARQALPFKPAIIIE